LKKTPIEIPYILNKDFILNNLMTKNGDRFNTNLFKTIKIHKSYKWCSSISEYLYCILTYKNKTAKMINIMIKYIDTGGDIETDVAYRRLRYYDLTSKRDSLQMKLQNGKKLFDILFMLKYNSER